MSFADLISSADRLVLQHLGGTPVVYTPEVGAPVSVVGIFDDQYVLPSTGHVGVEQVTPAVWLVLDDLPSDPREENPLIDILGVTYNVRKRPTDGVEGGTIRLILRRSGM